MEVSFKIKREQGQIQEKTSTVSSDKYPCLSIFLPILQNEYMEEKSRADRIDNKSVALLTIIIALITIYVPIFPFDQFVEIYANLNTHCALICIFSVFLLLGVVALLLAIYSAKKIMDIVKPTEYQAVNIEYFNTNERLARNPPHPFQVELITHYQSIILANSNVNVKKAESLNKQVRNVIIIFVLLSISAIGTLIFAGVVS